MSEVPRPPVDHPSGADRRRMIAAAGIVAGLAIVVASSTNSTVTPDPEGVSRIVASQDPGFFGD